MDRVEKSTTKATASELKDILLAELSNSLKEAASNETKSPSLPVAVKGIWSTEEQKPKVNETVTT